MAELYIATAERYDHSAILLNPNPDNIDETISCLDLIREKSGDRYFLMRHGDVTFSSSALATNKSSLVLEHRIEVCDAYLMHEEFW